FVGYFIGSPGMNVLPVKVEGNIALVGDRAVHLPGLPKGDPAAITELGVRPEHVRVGREGMRVSIAKVEDIGRHRIVHAALDGHRIAAILPEEAELPAEPHVSFEPAGINLYADSWRIETGA